MLIIVCYIVVPLKCIRIFLSCGEWIHNIEAQHIIQNDCIEITICVATMLIETRRRLVLHYYNREAKTIVKNVVVLFYIKVHTGWVYPLIDDDIPILNACFWLSFASFRTSSYRRSPFSILLNQLGVHWMWQNIFKFICENRRRLNGNYFFFRLEDFFFLGF